jgi:hypothetical protein
MKTLLLRTLLILTLAPAVYGEGDDNYVPEIRNTSETFTSKVLKVYAFQEGDLHYAAYVVSWRGHEVVVTAGPGDTSTKTHAVGDSIRCRMHHLTRKTDTGTTAYTQFILARGAEDEQARLEAIEASVQSRRALRKSIHSTPAQKTP